jgi:hypothetical protein
MKNQKIILTAIIIVLLLGNVFLGLKYLADKKEAQKSQAALFIQQTNDKVLSFTSLFIEKVLKADSEVNFETRLELENAVRNLGDQEILAQWQKFTEAQTQDEAQSEVKNLLGLLVEKIK